MGILRSQQILTSLKERLTSPCFEMVALSPSIMGKSNDKSHGKTSCAIDNFTQQRLDSLEEISFQCEECFELTFRKSKRQRTDKKH